MINHMSTKLYVMHHRLYFIYNPEAMINILLLLKIDMNNLRQQILRTPHGVGEYPDVVGPTEAENINPSLAPLNAHSFGIFFEIP